MREAQTASGGAGAKRLGTHPRRLRVRSLLLLVVLIPTLGLVLVATASASRMRSDRDAAEHLQAEAAVLAAIADARAAVAGEETQSAVVSIASDLGLTLAEVSDLYGVDYLAQMAAAREAVDSSDVLDGLPEAAGAIAVLDRLRPELDAGTATFEQTNAVFVQLGTILDAAWRARFAALHRELSTESLRGSVHEQLEATSAAFDALSWGNLRASMSIQLLQGEPGSVGLEELLEAQIQYDTAVDALGTASGPLVEASLRDHLDAPAGRRFELTLVEVADTAVAGEVSPLAIDPAAFGVAFVDGAPWAAGLTGLVRAAATDLRAGAASQVHDANRDLQTQVALATLLTVLALTGAALLSRSVARPIRRMEESARQIHDGRFDIDPIESGGPRELADTASAFNEMAFTLAAVEAHAVALADDPDAPVLNTQLPGRTGRALQVALNRLRSSIRSAEQHRRDLEEAATHDGLTGLLNRTAAFVMIERDLSRAAREGGTLAALFIDLDGLKAINDVHGHAAGDDALRLTAEALRASTRTSDVVARIGGDEFLVAGVVEEEDELEALAERVRQAVADQELACPDENLVLHCSIGVAVSESGRDTVETLVKHADAALYVAKGRGRNQVAWHEGSRSAER